MTPVRMTVSVNHISSLDISIPFAFLRLKKISDSATFVAA